jgi:hypothetical protein
MFPGSVLCPGRGIWRSGIMFQGFLLCPGRGIWRSGIVFSGVSVMSCLWEFVVVVLLCPGVGSGVVVLLFPGFLLVEFGVMVLCFMGLCYVLVVEFGAVVL